MRSDPIAAPKRPAKACDGAVCEDLPVIIMTALADDHIRAQALAAGANAFLLKPCSPDELEVAIRKVLAAKPRP